MTVENALEDRPIYPAGDLASAIAGQKHRADMLQAAAKSSRPFEAFASGVSPVANETPAPAQAEPVGNRAAEYLGLGQAAIT